MLSIKLHFKLIICIYINLWILNSFDLRSTNVFELTLWFRNTAKPLQKCSELLLNLLCIFIMCLCKKNVEQECIRVGCILHHWPYIIVSRGSAQPPWMQTPQGCRPPSWMQTPGCRPPWMQSPTLGRRNDTRLWKLYLPATTVATGKNYYFELTRSSDKPCSI